MKNAIKFFGLASLFLLATSPCAKAAIIYSQTQSGAVGFPDSTPVVLTFTGALPAATDATLSLFATGGELALNNKRLEQLNVDGDTFETLGSPAGWIRPVNFLNDVGVLADPVIIPLADLNNYVIDGQVMVSVVRPNFISGGTFDLVLEYTSSVPEPSSGLLLVLGMAGVALPRRRRRSQFRSSSAGVAKRNPLESERCVSLPMSLFPTISARRFHPSSIAHTSIKTRCTTFFVMAAVLLVPASLDAAITSGLEAYYTFDAQDGSDSSGNNLDLSLFGGIGFESGLFGSSLAPNGDNTKYAARTQDDNSLDFGTGDFTIQTWVNFNNTGGEQILIEKFTGVHGPGWTLTKLSNNKFGFATGVTPSPTIQSSVQTIPVDTWHNITIRRTSGLFDLFYNNQIIASINSGLSSSSSVPLLFGRRNATDGRDFSLEGSLDEVGIWSRSLTNQEISNLYNAGQGQSIPEPASGLLLVLAIGASMINARRRVQRGRSLSCDFG